MLERNLAGVVMHLVVLRGRRNREQLTGLANLLTSDATSVLTYTGMAVWAAACDPENRADLGELFVVDAIVHVLEIKSHLPLKEILLGALWLLSCNEKNAVRLTMHGAVPLLVGMVLFPFEKPYAPSRTLSVGTLLQLVSTSADIRVLVSQYCFAESLLQAVYDASSSTYLIVMASALVFELAQVPEALAEFVSCRGETVLEDISNHMVMHPAADIRGIGVYRVTALAMRISSKVAFARNGAIKSLVTLLREGSMAASRPVRLKVLHALLNISSNSTAQIQICKKALRLLITISRAGSGETDEDADYEADGDGDEGEAESTSLEEAKFARSILANLSNNVKCRIMMFKQQLEQGSNALTVVKSAGGSHAAFPGFDASQSQMLSLEQPGEPGDTFMAETEMMADGNGADGAGGGDGDEPTDGGGGGASPVGDAQSAAATPSDPTVVASMPSAMAHGSSQLDSKDRYISWLSQQLDRTNAPGDSSGGASRPKTGDASMSGVRRGGGSLADVGARDSMLISRPSTSGGRSGGTSTAGGWHMTASRKQLHILRKSITSPVSRLWEEEQLSLTAPRRRLGHSLSGSGGGSVSALSSLPSKAKGKSSLGPLPLNTTGQPGGEHRSATSGLGSADGSAGDGAVDGESVGGAGADAELDDDLDGGNGFNDDSLVGSAVLSHLARPNSPMRSSHRVGPIGALGSVRVERGENRWNPVRCVDKPALFLFLCRFFCDTRAVALSSFPWINRIDQNVLKFTQDQPSDSEVRATSKQLASKQQNEVMTLQVPANIVDSLVKRFGVVKIEAPDAVELAPQMVLVQLPASDQRLALHLLSKCSAMPLKSALQRRHPRKVELEPRTAYNSIVFHGPPRASGTELSPVRLAKFDHTPGATVYCGLFDVYDMPTGEQCFFCTLRPIESTPCRFDVIVCDLLCVRRRNRCVRSRGQGGRNGDGSALAGALVV